MANASTRTNLVRRRKRRSDADIAVPRVTAERKGAPRRHDFDAGCPGQRDDALGAVVEHIEADEITAARLGPDGYPGAAEPSLEHVLHGGEFRLQQTAMPASSRSTRT